MAAKQKMPTPLRMPDDVEVWVKARASANDRSINREIVSLLREAMQGSKTARQTNKEASSAETI